METTGSAGPPARRGAALVVDVANVLGSRPDGWWRDRAAAAGRLLARLTPLVGTQAAGPDHRPYRIDRIVAIVEGAAVTAAAPQQVEVVRADRDGDSAVVAVVLELLSEGHAAVDLVVVTADRALRQRLSPRVGCVGPNWLNRLIGR